MVKKALLIGCNYPGTIAELRGCINDVKRVNSCLIKIFGFSKKNIEVLIDTDPSFTQPTGKNIMSKLTSLVEMARPNDVLVVHFSGHGMRLVSNNPGDDSRFIQCIVPTDFNPITGNDFRKIVDKVPRDCDITIIADSCHSGGLIQAAKVQIGVSTKKECSWFGFGNVFKTFVSLLGIKLIEPHAVHGKCYSHVKNRSLSVPFLIDIVKLKTGKDDIDEGNLIHTLYDMFVEDLSPGLKDFMEFGFDSLHHGGDGGNFEMVGRQKSYSRSSRSSISDCGVLLSASQSDQEARELSFSGDPNEVYGAFSNAFLATTEETRGVITNWELVMETTKKLALQHFTQKPGLYCSDCNVDAPFVCDLIMKQEAKMEALVAGQAEFGKLEEKNEGLEADMEDQQWVFV